MDHEASTSYDALERMLLDESAEPMSLPLSLLQYITNRFSPDHQIGSGGFAVIYKGVVGKGMVAVKKLLNTFDVHENKFHEEVKCLIMCKHKNIVRFLGYCADTQGKMENYEGMLVMADQRNWLLCFEYVQNESLDKHITDASCGLEWKERYLIINGICEGLLFLHEKRILHLDLKPANILLDGQMLPKICDFGLSRCFSEEQTRAVTRSRCGTLGYMDPEYLKSGQITFASDIYSLGVIIMEILTGLKGYLKAESVVASWMNRLQVTEGDMQLVQVRVCTEIGIECMDLDPNKRPVARDIIGRLNKMAGDADYPNDETSIGSSPVELQVSFPSEQSGERKDKLAAETLQNVDVEDHTEISDDFAERVGELQIQEGQQKFGQASLSGVQNMKKKVNRHGASFSRSISTVFYKLRNLDIFKRKERMTADRNNSHILEVPDNVRTFRMEDLGPIIRDGNLIGKGDFSEAYKGVLDDALVVVKKPISGDMRDNRVFARELCILSRLMHKNLVRFIGCCLEMDGPILVHEFIYRGSLDDNLHRVDKEPLNLDVRLSIVAESAQGLAYLHSEFIRHGNVKPTNILLCENFMPKISGFFLSRFVRRNDEYTTHMFGGLIYTDPVYIQTYQLTQKSDVYSFGVVILEVISRKKASTNPFDRSLVRSFLEVHEKGKKATELFDKEIAVTEGDLEILDSLAEIAVECLNLDVDQRPKMTDVAERLLTLQRYHRSQAVRQ
ncbi:unnamed protein product [Alopecurus aequalis]